MSPVTLTVGMNGYSYGRNHFLDKKSVGVAEEENYSNKGIKTDVSTFAMVQYKPVKGIVFSGNIQYRYAAFDYFDYLNKDMSFNRGDFGTEWDFCNFGFTFEYTPENSTKVYAKFNHVNREPTRSDMFGGNESFTGELATLKAEKANDVEFGFEYTMGDKIYANVNFYHMQFNNELVLNGDYGLNGLPCHDNASDSYRNGMEVDVRWKVISNFNFDVNGAYSSNMATTKTFGKTNHILTPSITANADAYWKNYNYVVGLNTNYRSKMYVDMANENYVPYLWTLNFYASYMWKSCEFGIRVNNLTNKVNYCSGAVNDVGEMLYFRNAGTNFNLSVKYVF